MIGGGYSGWGIRTRATSGLRSVLPSGPAAWVAIRTLIALHAVKKWREYD